ncbi:histidine kinase [Actinomadura fulvescens]|uniref:Signal transduction histidine kinase subgroup 3 dimerisation and phosphoacceptor domain-containing protein n=1 Tax=Actinomadura fulvescens TaxID=46160 RepID=A0ABP6BX37_9ACTN
MMCADAPAAAIHPPDDTGSVPGRWRAMSDGEQRGPRLAEAVVLGFLLSSATAFVLSRLTYFGLSWRTAGYLAAVAPVVVLQLVHSSTRGGGRALARYTLPLQALFTYLPYLYFGEIWVGLPAFLAGSVLILLRGWAAWALFALVVGSSAFFGGGYGGGTEGTWYALLCTLNISLALFGLSHLGAQVARVAATLDELAGMAVIAERLRASRHLDQAIGRGLSAIARQSATAAAARSAAETAAATAEILRLSRRALNEARTVAVAYRAPSPVPAASGDETAAHLALRLLFVLYVMYLTAGLHFLVETRAGLVEWLAAAGSVAGILLLQLRHVLLRLRGSPVRDRYRNLAGQVVLAYVPQAVPGFYWSLPLGLVAASALLLLPRRAAWTLCAILLVSGPMLASLGSRSPLQTAYGWVAGVASGTVIYGLIWLVEMAGDLRAARAELARMAVLAERLRVAGDVHDLLGYGLSAITLKTELARQLLPEAPGRAHRELVEVSRLARSSLDELRDMTEGSGDLSLVAEADSARAVLAALDIEAVVTVPSEPLPKKVDVELAAVLREAITNVVRHSAARRVVIKVTVADGVRLQVVNDGIREGPAEPSTGMGIVSMTTRVEALGGRLTAVNGPDGRFHLSAEVPGGNP